MRRCDLSITAGAFSMFFLSLIGPSTAGPPTSAQECAEQYQKAVDGVAACISAISEDDIDDDLRQQLWELRWNSDSTPFYTLLANKCLQKMEADLLMLKQSCGGFLPQFAGSRGQRTYCIALRTGANACRANATSVKYHTGIEDREVTADPGELCTGWDDAIATECPRLGSLSASLSSNAPCGEQRQRAQACYDNCKSAGVIDKHACQNNCAAYEADLLKFCEVLNTPPKTIKRVVGRSSKTTKSFVEPKRAVDNDKKTKANLDRFDLGPTFVSPDSSSAVSRTARGTSSPKMQAKTVGTSDAAKTPKTSGAPMAPGGGIQGTVKTTGTSDASKTQKSLTAPIVGGTQGTVKDQVGGTGGTIKVEPK